MPSCGRCTSASLRAAARMGYTSVQEMSVGVPQQRHLSLVEQADIPIRWRAIGFPLTLDERCEVPSRLSPLRPFAKKTAVGLQVHRRRQPISKGWR